jgi:hypothetical protein
MLQKLLHHLTGRVLFAAEIEADTDTSGDVRLGLAVKAALEAGADLRGADLGGADLGGADLGGADLGEADLRGACLRGADWGDGAQRREGVPITRAPVMVATDLYDVWIWDRHVEIGCRIHEIEEWAGFDAADIAGMGGGESLRFWRTWRDPLLAVAKAAGCPLPAPEARQGENVA